MSAKHAATILAILLTAVLAVGLILCRPMTADNYGTGTFSFSDVTEAAVQAYESTPGVPAPVPLRITADDMALGTLIGLMEERGFGRTPASLFASPDPELKAGQKYFLVAFYCGATGSRLTVEYSGGSLIFHGADDCEVLVQNRSSLAQSAFDTIRGLYPDE